MFTLDVGALALERGACLAVTGPSGCGKSTLLEVLAGLRRPENGAVVTLAHDPDEPPIELQHVSEAAQLRQQLIGYVPQSGGVLPFLTAHEQTMAPLHLAGLSGSDAARTRLGGFADLLDLTDHLEKRRAALSGGQRKRVALMAGLAVRRLLLLADEPTSGLDADNARQVMMALAGVAKTEGSVVIIATHDVDLARRAEFEIATITDHRLELETDRESLPA
nr:ATP-binding cassette domain-containing protein [Octadecabacter dasysiphoniae]